MTSNPFQNPADPRRIPAGEPVAAPQPVSGPAPYQDALSTRAPYGPPQNAGAQPPHGPSGAPQHPGSQPFCGGPSGAPSPYGYQQSQDSRQAYVPQQPPTASWGGAPPFRAPGFVPPPPGDLPPRRFTNEQIVAFLLAAAGVVVTLVGVVLLLVTAARGGWLTPPVRVAGGVIGAAALAGAATWVRRRPGGRVGSVALLATAASAAYFDVVAVTRIYDWVPLSMGLVMAFAVAAAAGLLAVRWDEKWLFVALTLAVGLFAPSLTGGPGLALVAFLFVIQLVGVAPELTKRWDELALARTAPVVLATTFWIDLDHTIQVPVMVGFVAATGVVTVLLTATTCPDARWAAGAYVIAWLPTWVLVTRYERTTWAVAAGVATLVSAATWWALRHAGRELRSAGLGATGVNALVLAFALTAGPWIALPYLAVAFALFVAQGLTRRPLEGRLALAALVLAVITQQQASPTLDLFYRARAAHMPAGVVVSGLAMMAVAGAALWSVRGRGLVATHVQATLVGAGAAGLLGLSMASVAGLGRTPSSFFVMHLVITVSALALAAAVLVAGLTRPRHLSASMRWGLALIGCAFVKLLAFDLAYMGAATKAMTCVVGGLVLLAAGTTYSRTYAAASRAKKAGEAPQTWEPGAPQEPSGTTSQWPPQGV